MLAHAHERLSVLNPVQKVSKTMRHRDKTLLWSATQRQLYLQSFFFQGCVHTNVGSLHQMLLCMDLSNLWAAYVC